MLVSKTDKARKRAKVFPEILPEGEVLEGFFQIALGYLFITSLRVGTQPSIGRHAVNMQVPRLEIVGVDVDRGGDFSKLTLQLSGGRSVLLGFISNEDDTPRILKLLRAGLPELAKPLTKDSPTTEKKRSSPGSGTKAEVSMPPPVAPMPKAFKNTKANNSDVLKNRKMLDKLEKHLNDDETVEVIIWSVGAGYLLSTQDRCIIAKISVAQSLMAGSLGGGRVASFYHSDITAIEYNSGLASGVLEILTASYQGTKNQDFWRGTFNSRNANASDPYTLSNTLPLGRYEFESAKPLISVIRKQISAAKNPIAAPAQQPIAPRLEGSLSEISALHDAGKLTDQEFAAAKAKILGLS